MEKSLALKIFEGFSIQRWNDLVRPFVEWSDANLESHLEGINFPTNMLYSEALIMAGKLLDKQNLTS